ncbi:WW domain binding protein 1 S homeolog [Xenopus laevis]|uniref:WW domain binding protein 1 S homeolog n=1 Tax=Xenopus laevis TaxID=8355 RepID=Q4V823_XENLA|nr:WW domain binding protein 1 S homeolog [Xenopus laevis]AAH97596.1 Unknown (protein for MGC:114817) [Xenopus laevis]
MDNSGGLWERKEDSGRLAQEQCPGVNSRPYVCETGHCCGENGCCTYYYELWWFWFLWSVLILLSCCCAYRHRRAKLHLQHQQRQREINLITYQRASHYSPSTLDLRVLASFKLPAYEEVACRPTTPPPPYSSILNPFGPPSSPPPSLEDTASPSTEPSSCCSCNSDCETSGSSSSFSLQVTDETGASQGSTASWEESPEEEEQGAIGRGAAFSSYVDLFEGGSHICWAIEEEEEDDDDDDEEEEERYRRRRLTGDSGIEVCRCQIVGEEEERSDPHDSPGCAERNKTEGGESPLEKDEVEADSPVQPV